MDFTSFGFLGGDKSSTVFIFLWLILTPCLPTINPKSSTSGLEKAHFL
jgi:hypothetical protein